jgi:hypothetical protein
MCGGTVWDFEGWSPVRGVSRSPRRVADPAAEASTPRGARDGFETLARQRVEIGLLRERVSQLHRALDSSAVIGQASGILAARLDRSVEEALELLRRAARCHGVPVRELAAEAVAARAVPPKVSILLFGETVRQSI